MQAGIGHRRSGDGRACTRWRSRCPGRQIAVGRLKEGERVDVFVTYDERTASVVRGAQVVQIGAEDDGSLTSDREISLVVAVPSGDAVAALVHALRTGDVTVVRSTFAEASVDDPLEFEGGGATADHAPTRRGVMAGDRFVVLGVAQVRSPWFREVARWATSAMLPVEFVKAMSVEEVRVRLRSGRGYSALLVDDSLPGVDRDLVELAREGGCAVLVVDSGRASRQWGELGASALLAGDLRPRRAAPGAPAGGDADHPLHRRLATAPRPRPSPTGFRGRLVAVTGAPGAGRSTIAAALAQGLASDPRHTDLVCLADLALHADQAMLHGSPDVVPGLTELVEGHRSGAPSIDDVRGLTWHVTTRGYDLLLGLRRHRDWTAVRPRAFAAALDGLRRGFRIVVADVDDDLEGEQATGSVDVEERNAIARTTISAADLVLVVGQPGLKGLHSHLRTTRASSPTGCPASASSRSSTARPRARAPEPSSPPPSARCWAATAPACRARCTSRAPPPRRGPPRRRPVPRRLARPGGDERPGGPRSRGGAGRRRHARSSNPSGPARSAAGPRTSDGRLEP